MPATHRLDSTIVHHEWNNAIPPRLVVEPGDTVALGRLEEIGTGETLAGSKSGAKLKGKGETLTPVYGLAVAAADRKDEVKLSTAIAKLREEDPSLQFDQNPEQYVRAA